MTSNDIVSAVQANILLKEATQCYIDRNYAPALVKFENAYNILFTIKILRRKNIIDIGLLLMNWSGALIQTHDYHHAIKRGEESWGYLNNNLIINDSGLDLARANLMSNLSTAYISIGRVYAAYEKLELSDQLFKKISGDQPSSDHCMMLMHWAMAYEKEHLFSNALEKYQEAFSRWPGIKVAELCYDNSLATLYLNWGIVCNTLDRTDDALQKLNQSWIIRGVNLALDPKYEIGRVKILSSLANVYSKLQRYNEAEEKHADALKRLSKPGFKDTPEANFERTIILANMAGDRIERLDAESAIKAYETALLNTDREEDLLKINNQLGVAYLEQKNYAKALDLLLASKKNY